MNYNDTFIKGVTYGEAEELWDTARSAGFIAFLGEFHKLADGYAQERLEDFINDHFPDDTMTLLPKSGGSIFDLLCEKPSKIDELIAKVRSHREE